jgi:hypothetical protein
MFLTLLSNTSKRGKLERKFQRNIPSQFKGRGYRDEVESFKKSIQNNFSQ